MVGVIVLRARWVAWTVAPGLLLPLGPTPLAEAAWPPTQWSLLTPKGRSRLTPPGAESRSSDTSSVHTPPPTVRLRTHRPARLSSQESGSVPKHSSLPRSLVNAPSAPQEPSLRSLRDKSPAMPRLTQSLLSDSPELHVPPWGSTGSHCIPAAPTAAGRKPIYTRG